MGETKSLLRRVRQLHDDPRARRADDAFWIEGPRHFIQAVDAKYAFETVVYSRVLAGGPMLEMLVRRLERQGVPVRRVSPELFRGLSSNMRASGIGAIVRKRWRSLDALRPAPGRCYLVLDEIRSPGNLGTILRTAEACSVDGVIFVGRHCDPFDPATVRASMGGLFPLSLIRATPAELQAWRDRQAIEFVGLSPRAEKLWVDMPQEKAIGLVIGEEREGISSQLAELCHTSVRLPMSGRADSLNVGIATAVVLYEIVRRECVKRAVSGDAKSC